MPWIIGIDEAGYGPNLGPLVMTSVAWRVPEKLAGADLWQVLAAAVRRAGEAADERLLVADSKVVYSTARGLHGLESGVFATRSPLDLPTLAHLIADLCPAADLSGERWYSGVSPLPVGDRPDELATLAERFGEACAEQRVEWGLVRSVLVCPARFNAIVDRHGSKGAVLGHGLAELLRANLAADERGPMHFYIDKHGGRNTYAAMLQDALPSGFVAAHEERLERSVYSIRGQRRDVRLTFQPRADVEHFCVALASMISKYLREVLMREFNRFWQSHVPGLKPTAGYPVDAARFFEAIRPAAARLGLNEAALWRKK
jgi:ribonuclease HII